MPSHVWSGICREAVGEPLLEDGAASPTTSSRRGVPRDRIVLGYKPPRWRARSGFAA